MKQLTVIFTILTALLLATSCSKEELPGGESTDEPGQTQTYTFTVLPDITMKGDAKTRSAGTEEEKPTRCFMQILWDNVISDIKKSEPNENGNFTFSVELLSNTDYTFLFWADNGSGDTPTDLREVQYTPGAVAFAARKTDTPENIINKGVSLKHAVAKVTLQTTEATSASEEESIKVTTTCATTYNVDDPSASSYSEQTATKTFDASTGFEANSNIATFYFIPKSETQSVDVEFHLLKQTIESVPLAANTHVTLQGNLSEDNPNWGATSKYVEEQIKHFFTNEDGNSKGTPGTNGYYFYLPESDIDKFESVIGAILHEEVEISLDGFGTILEKEFEDDYIFIIRNDIYSKILTIYIGYTPVYNISYNHYDTNYENFSTVSHVLEQSTK